MRFRSIRTRVAVLTALFAFLLVGSVTIATYFFVANGMADSAERTSWRLGSVAARVVKRLDNDLLRAALASGVPEAEARRLAGSRAREEMPERFAGGLIFEGAYALWVVDADTGDLVLEWKSEDRALAGTMADRQEALASGSSVRGVSGSRPLLPGLFTRAKLGTYVVHAPVEFSDGRDAVLDVIYEPDREEATLDATRLPMLAVAVLALAASIVITGVIMGWVLSLIESIRAAADSIDEGLLDVHLPEEGQNEIAELARSLNRLIDNLRARNEAQTRFIADASHELATPVAGIRGYVNILRAWGAEDVALREEAVSAIDRESRRMARLCSDLLSVIRSEEMVEYRQIRYDINAVVREVLANAATRYLEKGFEYAGPDAGQLWIYGDPDRVEEALGILVDNACKYTPARGRISVTTHRRRDRAVIDVADTGVGIPTEDLPNVFERFYRSDLSRSKETGGFGLGLAIAKHIVDASGGEVTVTSEVGRGTTFTVSLPRQRTRG